MSSLIRRSITKWLIFAILGLVAVTGGYFFGQRQGEIHRLREQPPMAPQDAVLPL